MDNNDKVFRVAEGGYYRIGEQVVYINADGTFKIKTPTQKVYAKTQTGHKAETTSVTSTPIEVLEKTKQALRTIRNEMNYRIWQIERGDLSPMSDSFINGEMYQAVRIADEALALKLTTEGETTNIEKPQENCPTRDECADMYADLRKANERNREIEAENERLTKEVIDKNISNEWYQLSRQLERELSDTQDEAFIKHRDIEAKLKLATSALETLQTEADDWHLRGIARETLEKLNRPEIPDSSESEGAE